METLRALLILAAVILLAVSHRFPTAGVGWACAVAGFGMPIMQAGFH